MAMDWAPLLSRGDVIAEVEWRSDGLDRLRPFAHAPTRCATVIQDAAEDALIDVDAFHLVQAHLEGAAFDEAGLVHNPQIGHVGLGGPAVEPAFRLPVQP